MDRPVKRVRYADLTGNGQAVVTSPELNRIQQSQCQLDYLQAQLAATEALYAAYQEELGALHGQLRDVKRIHLQSGQPLWKDPCQGQPQHAGSRGSHAEDGLTTFSDIEEEVLLQPEDAPVPPVQQESQQQATTQPGPSAGSPQQPGEQQQRAGQGQRPVSPGAAEARDASDGDRPGGAASAEGTASANAEAGAGVAATGAPACTAGGTDAGPSATALTPAAAAGAAGAGQGPGSARLAELESLCSAVAAEDMEAQGALACLAGRAARYYLRSTMVTLGRATETKGEVDLDLSLEEAAAGRRSAAAAGAGGAAGAAGANGGAAPGAAPPGAEGAGGGGVQAQGQGGTAAPAAAAAGRHQISRRAAMIRLGPDGQFRLVNSGRQALYVNDVEVPPHMATTLPHLSLLRIADVALIFMANPAAVARCVRRTAALVL